VPGGPPGLQNRCAALRAAGGFDSRPPPLSCEDSSFGGCWGRAAVWFSRPEVGAVGTMWEHSFTIPLSRPAWRPPRLRPGGPAPRCGCSGSSWPGRRARGPRGSAVSAQPGSGVARGAAHGPRPDPARHRTRGGHLTAVGRNAIWEHATQTAGDAAAHIRALAGTNPAAAAHSAWAASDNLHLAAAALDSRILRHAADAHDRGRPRPLRAHPRPARRETGYGRPPG
jgi:hypothetical protein